MINNATDQDNEIYILNGQNISQIEKYKQLKNTNKWNPCIPITFYGDKSITITFTSSSNWYPLNICNYQNNSMSYQNEYLFDGGKNLTINNLNINDYIIDDNTNYPISRSISNKNALITVNHGLFINISSSITAPLFKTQSNLYIYNTSFRDITVSNQVFYATHDALYADESDYSIRFENGLFYNISAETIYQSAAPKDDVKQTIILLSIHYDEICYFDFRMIN